MTPTGLTRADVERDIDLLDSNEPSGTGWEAAFDRLRPALGHARKVRNRFRVPIVTLFLISAALWSVHRLAPDLLDVPRMWLQTPPIVCGALFLLVEVIARTVFPVLQREERVAALLRYYGATDVSPDQEVY